MDLMAPTTKVDAVYGKHGFTLEVIAFDDDGEAYVITEGTDGCKRLRQASMSPEFKGLTISDTANVVGVLPGGGWLATSTTDDGETYTEPVIGWAVDSHGWSKAITTEDSSGMASVDLGSNTRIWHPGTQDSHHGEKVSAHWLAMEWRERESFHGQMAEGDLDRMAAVAIELLTDASRQGS